MSTKIFDVAIVGSGPAGYSASVYASRYNLNNVVFGKLPGGTISEAHKVCNYLAFEEITGLELSDRFSSHAKNFGAEIQNKSVVDIKKVGDIFKIYTESDNIFEAKSVILATGTKRKKLAIPDEDKYIGKGVSYCATCDSNFFKEKMVAVVGGSNAATTAALLLSEVATHVYIIYRKDSLRGDQKWVEAVLQNKKIEVIYNTLVIGLKGNGKLEGITLDTEFNRGKLLKVDGLFIEIGSEPNGDLPLKLGLKTDEVGYIKTKEDQSTNIEGIWAAGDMTTNSNRFQQVVTAVSEGAIAANSVYQYLKT